MAIPSVQKARGIRFGTAIRGPVLVMSYLCTGAEKAPRSVRDLHRYRRGPSRPVSNGVARRRQTAFRVARVLDPYPVLEMGVFEDHLVLDS